MFDVREKIRLAQNSAEMPDLSEVVKFRNAIFNSTDSSLQSFAVHITRKMHSGEIFSRKDVIAEAASNQALFSKLLLISIS